ncbi:MAG: MarR family winged helix-turn-helix transcriptional regulator [Pseudobdellovibrionaceae bacterium]
MRIEKFLETSPLFILFGAYSEIIGGYQKRFAREGVHFLEALVLTGIFFEEKPVRPTALAKTFSSSKSNISHTLRSLEKKGLIERNISQEDARAYFFSITKEGLKKVPKLVKIFDSTEQQIENAFAGMDLNKSLRVFRKIYRGLEFPK